MNEWVPGWKVICATTTPTGLPWRCSIIVFGAARQWYPVQQVVGRPHSRDFGPLTVFRDRPSAERFLLKEGKGTNGTIVRCAYLPSADTRVWAYEMFGGIDLNQLPPGTALADAVCCLE